MNPFLIFAFMKKREETRQEEEPKPAGYYGKEGTKILVAFIAIIIAILGLIILAWILS